MTKRICDCCGKEIRDCIDLVSVDITTAISIVGGLGDQELHFHIECYTCLQNKFSHFIDEIKKGDK